MDKEIKFTDNIIINGVRLPETPAPEIRYDGIFSEIKILNLFKRKK